VRRSTPTAPRPGLEDQGGGAVEDVRPVAPLVVGGERVVPDRHAERDEGAGLDLVRIGWAPTATGDYELRMAVLVKTNGRLGRFYMALIAPFRHLIVYPLLARQWNRAWKTRPSDLKTHQP
jgi:hypothetical protein